MHRIRLDEDIKPLSEFRANAASLVQQVRTTQRPLVLTQRGHSAAVVLDVGTYERMVEELALQRDVQTAEQQLDAGQGIDHDGARSKSNSHR